MEGKSIAVRCSHWSSSSTNHIVTSTNVIFRVFIEGSECDFKWVQELITRGRSQKEQEGVVKTL